MKLKYAIWLRNVLLVLLLLLTLDFIAKRYYNHVSTAGSPIRLVGGLTTCLLLQYYIRKEQTR